MKTIFVSSTFKDFQIERDALRDYVLPQINSIAKKYGETIDFCDLRWGINTTQLDSSETARKVLSVCLDEIDRCSPPMIVILGYRYGWIPDNQETIAFESRKRSLDLSDLEISVTALEIEYGALLSETKRKNTLFYFREIENAPKEFYDLDDVSAKKLANLKERILTLSEGKVKSYQVSWKENQEYDIDNFVNIVRDDIIDCYLPQWQELIGLSHTKRLIQTQKAIIEDKASRFFSRTDLFNSFRNILEDNNYLILKGESGYGKSMLFSKIVTQYEEMGWQIVPVICGASSSSTAFDVLIMIVNMLEELLGKEPFANYDKQEKSICLTALYNLCDEAKQRKIKTLIAVDAIDQLLEDEDRKSLLFFPKNLNETTKLIMTVQPHINLYDLKYYEVSMLSADEKRDFINGYVKCFRKELDSSVIEAIVEKGEKCTPLYLTLLLQRLTMMNRADFLDVANNGDSIEAIINKQIDIIENSPSSIEQQCVILFDEAGKRINPVISKTVLKYIAVSRLGLRILDLQALLGDLWNNLDFSLLISYLNDCFIIRKDGRVDFSHQIIKSSISTQYDDAEKSVINRTIYHYLNSLDDDDSIKLSEIGFHCIKGDDCEGYFSLIQHGFSKSHLLLNILAKDTYQEYLPTLPNFTEYLSTFKNVFARNLVFSNLLNCFANNHILLRTASFLSYNRTTDISLLGKFVVKYIIPLFNGFSPIEIYGKLNLLQGFAQIVQMCAEHGSISDKMIAFEISLIEGDIYYEFSKIADLHEHDDNQDNNRKIAIAFYQKQGLKYLAELKDKVSQDQYLICAATYNQRMEEASVYASIKSRYLVDYLVNINQISQITEQQNVEVTFGHARRAYYAAFNNSLFTKLYIEQFEESFGSIDYKKSPEIKLKLLLHYYYLIIASHKISAEKAKTYLYKAFGLIDEIIVSGLSPMMLLEFVRSFVMIIELFVSVSDNSFKTEWIKTNMTWLKTHVAAIVNIIKNLYRIEPLLELAKNAVLLHYDLATYGIVISGDDIELYKKHIIDMASFNYDALRFVDFLAKDGHDELQNALKSQQETS